MVELSDKITRSLNPLSSSTVQSARQAGTSIKTQQAVQQAAAYALRCGRMPPRRLQSRSGKTCTPEIVLFDGPCSDQLAMCYLFRAEAFAIAQLKLRYYLANRPPAELHRERAQWCWDVLSTVADALDATNIPAELLAGVRVDSRYGAPESLGGDKLFTHVKEFTNQLEVQTRAQRGDAPIVVPIEPALGGDIESSAKSKEPFVPPSGSRVIVGTKPRRGTSCQGPDITDAIYDSYGADRNSQYFNGKALEYLHYLFLRHPEGGLAPAKYCYKTNVQDRSRKWASSWVLTGGALMDYCAAWANDVIRTDLQRFIYVGLTEWQRSLTPFYANGMLGPNFPMEDIAAIITESARIVATTQLNVMFGTLASSVALIPVVGWIAAIIVLVIQGILNLILLGADFAAGWDCPVLPFKRSAASGDCAVTTDTLLSDLNVGRIIESVLPRLTEYSGLTVFQDFSEERMPPPPPSLPPPVFVPPNELYNTTSKPIPWGTLGLIGGGIIGTALLLRMLRR